MKELKSMVKKEFRYSDLPALKLREACTQAEKMSHDSITCMHMVHKAEHIST